MLHLHKTIYIRTYARKGIHDLGVLSVRLGFVIRPIAGAYGFHEVVLAVERADEEVVRVQHIYGRHFLQVLARAIEGGVADVGKGGGRGDMHGQAGKDLTHTMIAGKADKRHLGFRIEREEVVVCRRGRQLLVGRRHDAVEADRGVAIVVVADVNGLVESDSLSDVGLQFRSSPCLRIGEGHMRLSEHLQPTAK